MDYLPLFVKLASRRCVVVGGGEVARRKIEWLLAAGARVSVIAPVIDPRVRELLGTRGELIERTFAAADVTGAVLVVAATNDAAVNRDVAASAERAGILVNAVDDAIASSAIFPSIVDRDPVVVAISSGGRSPTLARRVRSLIEARLPPRIGALAELLLTWRPRVAAQVPADGRRQFWEAVLDGAIPEAVYAGDSELAERLFDVALQTSAAPAVGFVSLVGAGPGAADLLTLKALRCIERADVLLYDNLVSNEVLSMSRRDARRVYVGKRRAFPSIRQESINAMLVEFARDGARVVRLKGGDPFIFGRGGEEIETLAARGVPFEVVPGITAALGCASCANIPLTHRDWAHSVRFVAGNLSGDRINLDWPELAKPDQTLVIYMGLQGLADISRELIRHGMSPDMPAALIARGTLADQRIVEAPLAQLATRVTAADIHGPTIVIIGRVVALRETLSASS
jgi:uroporphyrin-III C-methyltransferase / precorrin-2 dehydrogenase / sirohydrochlorin ferrochelatase